MRHVVVDVSGNIVNAVEWDGTAAWSPPAGSTTVQSATMNIGGTYISGVYTPPPTPPSPMGAVGVEIG